MALEPNNKQGLNLATRSASVDPRVTQQLIFPLEAFEFDDPNRTVEPELRMKTPWKFVADAITTEALEAAFINSTKIVVGYKGFDSANPENEDRRLVITGDQLSLERYNEGSWVNDIILGGFNDAEDFLPFLTARGIIAEGANLPPIGDALPTDGARVFSYDNNLNNHYGTNYDDYDDSNTELITAKFSDGLSLTTLDTIAMKIPEGYSGGYHGKFNSTTDANLDVQLCTVAKTSYHDAATILFDDFGGTTLRPTPFDSSSITYVSQTATTYTFRIYADTIPYTYADIITITVGLPTIPNPFDRPMTEYSSPNGEYLRQSSTTFNSGTNYAYQTAIGPTDSSLTYDLGPDFYFGLNYNSNTSLWEWAGHSASAPPAADVAYRLEADSTTRIRGSKTGIVYRPVVELTKSSGSFSVETGLGTTSGPTIESPSYFYWRSPTSDYDSGTFSIRISTGSTDFTYSGRVHSTTAFPINSVTNGPLEDLDYQGLIFRFSSGDYIDDLIVSLTDIIDTSDFTYYYDEDIPWNIYYTDGDIVLAPITGGTVRIIGDLEYGTDPIVVVSGPAGSTGDTGDTGATGAEGPQGESYLDGGTWDTIYAVEDDIDGGGW